MELARNFTRRNKRTEGTPFAPGRATSIRKHDGHVDHSLISAPLELLSTTNVLALNAPDLHSSFANSPFSSASSSADDSDVSLTFSASSRSTSPETSSVESAPSPVEPNHLTSYFESPGNSCSGSPGEVCIPAIPSRAKSHTKITHQAAARRRSNSRTQQPPVALHTSVMPARSSIDMFSGNPEPDHPFGAELAQVNELAEEIGANEAVAVDEEEQYLIDNGLCKFTVDDYLSEIQDYFGAFGSPYGNFNTAWI
ncbi:MAG: hypothetical protein LQ338_007486 [Usnochroma carphineum]|nr:MAG: hypothetical protein LQ338_007486 [Usnochroma carphineum]